jgi:hypothetical protein
MNSDLMILGMQRYPRGDGEIRIPDKHHLKCWNVLVKTLQEKRSIIDQHLC